MHKYQPRLHVVVCEGDNSTQLNNFNKSNLEDSKKDIARMFVFQETEFMAVTAYQNHMVSFWPIMLTSLTKISCLHVSLTNTAAETELNTKCVRAKD